jgi:hypothetical protein
MISRYKILFFLLFILMAIFFIANAGEKSVNLEEMVADKLAAKTDTGDFTIVDLGVSAESFDIASDNNNTLHIIWQEDDGFHYGKISGDTIIDRELVPDSGGIITKFQHPRLSVCPDGSSVHFAYINESPGAEMYHAWRDDGGWHNEVVWRKKGSFYISVPVVGEDLNGNLHGLAFKWAEDEKFRTSYFYKDSGQANWTEVEMVDSTRKYRDISFFIDYQGGVHATWKCGSGEGYYAYAPSGTHLHDAHVIAIPTEGVDASTIGDLFMDRDDVVHHACSTIVATNPFKVQYWTKALTADAFTYQGVVRDEAIEVCGHKDSWPSIGVDRQGRAYVAWADMPCPSKVFNWILMYVRENNTWTEYVMDNHAEMEEWAKTALAVTDFSVNLVWAGGDQELMLGRRITGAAVLLTPSDGSNVCGNQIDITASVQGFESDDPLANLELYIDDSLLTSTAEETLEYTYDVSGWELGAEHTIKAVATKQSGESVESEAVVVKDCSPDVTLVTCESGQENYDTIDMKGDASDDVAVEKLEFYGDGKVRGDAETPPYTAQWNITGWGKPKHTILVRAYDSAGNQGESAEIPMIFRTFSSPANITVENILNRTLFIKEWINVVRWEVHSKNSNKNITGYRVYQIDNGAVSKLAELGPDQFEFVHRNVEAGKMYVYRITAVAMINGAQQESTTGAAAILAK